MQLNIVIKGLIIVEKIDWKLSLIFLYRGQIFLFCGTKTHDTNTMERKESEPQAKGKLCLII